MKIVIFGRSGQLGASCASLLLAKNEISIPSGPRIDISAQANVDAYLDTTRPDVIINCAAFTAVDACETEIRKSWEVNTNGAKYLAQASERLACRLIHISTDYVFDGERPIPNPYLETDRPKPLSQYGRSKLAGEQAVARYAPNHIIIRTAWLYSVHGKNFLKSILKLAITKPNRVIRVVDDQYGSLTWTSSLALQIQRLLQSDLTGIVHATSEGHSTWYQAACYFLDAMAIDYTVHPCTTAEYPSPAHRPKNSILENATLKDAGISIFVSWQEDIDSFVGKYRQQLLDEVVNDHSSRSS